MARHCGLVMFFENREEESNERLRRKSYNVSRLRRDGVSHLYQVIVVPFAGMRIALRQLGVIWSSE